MATFYNDDDISVLAQDAGELAALRLALDTDAFRISYGGGTMILGTVDIDTDDDKNRFRVNVRASEPYDVRQGFAAFHAFTFFAGDIAYYPVPARIAAFLDDMQARGQREYISTELRTEWAMRSAMEAERESDPEGAFGGRGNNMRF